MLRIITATILFVTVSGCVSSVTTQMADNITMAISNQNDPATVRDGAPAYLLLIDGLIEGDPSNTDLLLSGSKLYGSYASAFVDDAQRAKRLANRSYDYARRGLCEELDELCDVLDEKLPVFQAKLSEVSSSDIKPLYGFAVAWAGWIQANASDWNALASVAKLTALFEYCATLDETYDDGGAHIYLGVLGSQLPPSLGGKPQLARQHFERALEISEGRNLMIYVLMAKHYARLVFDQELHDSLLATVSTAYADYSGYTLINSIAKDRAKQLLAESADYF